MKTLTEAEFKLALRNYFKGNCEQHALEYYCKEEVCSLYDSSVRFDLGIATYPKEEGSYRGLKLIGIEIKTDKDTFKRLAMQLPNYVKVFDEVYIAIQSKEIPEQIPQFIGVIRVNENQEVVIERHSEISGSSFEDYMNSFVFKRLLAELGFPIKDSDRDRLHKLLNRIYDLRKNLMANTFFGDRVENPRSLSEMKFTIPLHRSDKELLQSFFIPTPSKKVLVGEHHET